MLYEVQIIGKPGDDWETLWLNDDKVTQRALYKAACAAGWHAVRLVSKTPDLELVEVLESWQQH